jgi:polysaccharide deacetylase family protein (PEP-CTERM system associated)
VDVEDYFQVEAFSDFVKREDWNTYASRVDSNTRRVLDLFDECGVKATFFTLGWVAERYPALIREIEARGHEPAVHSFWHRLVYELSPEEFREDTRRAKQAIEQATGTAVTGYRAPSYSITRKSLWALDVLVELGFTYDSSIFPIRHDIYGIPDAPRAPFRWTGANGHLVEFPITTFRTVLGPNLPVAGGGYLRILPYWYTRFGVRRAASESLPIITYFHPWEIDPDQPRLPGRKKSLFRHYTNLGRMAARVKRLCACVNFQPFREILATTERPFPELSL